MAEPFVHGLRVRYSECDPQGVLFGSGRPGTVARAGELIGYSVS